MPKQKQSEKDLYSHFDDFAVSDTDSNDDREVREPEQEYFQAAQPVSGSAAGSTAGSATGFSFTVEDTKKLSINEHNRFFPASKKISHVLVSKNAKGETIAQQFKIPTDGETKELKTVELKKASFSYEYGALRLSAEAKDGTEMVATRRLSLNLKIDTNVSKESELYFLSPKKNYLWQGRTFWGADTNNKKSDPVFFRDLSEYESSKAKEKRVKLDKLFATVGQTFKQGEVLVNNADVVLRNDPELKRIPDQNTVMGRSAFNAVAKLGVKLHGHWSNQAQAIFDKVKSSESTLRKNEEAFKDMKNFSLGQYRSEWLHLIGWGLTPMNAQPQHKTNLAAGPKHINTEMMIIERVLKWHALSRGERAKIYHRVKFELFPQTDVIMSGDINGEITEENHLGQRYQVNLFQHLSPFKRCPQFSKPTDIVQATLVTHSLLAGKAPINELKVDVPEAVSFANSANSANSANRAISSLAAPAESLLTISKEYSTPVSEQRVAEARLSATVEKEKENKRKIDSIINDPIEIHDDDYLTSESRVVRRRKSFKAQM